MYRHSCNLNVALLFLFWHFGILLALWYPGTFVTLGTIVTWWHKRNFVALVQLLWERLGPRLKRWDQHSIWRRAARVSVVKLKVAIFSLLSTFCAPSTASKLIATASTKRGQQKMKHIQVVNYLVQKYNVIVSLTTKARASFVKEVKELRSSVWVSVR